jgi:hypothetical protein
MSRIDQSTFLSCFFVLLLLFERVLKMSQEEEEDGTKRLDPQQLAVTDGRHAPSRFQLPPAKHRTAPPAPFRR